jgi:hypothetical protein
MVGERLKPMDLTGNVDLLLDCWKKVAEVVRISRIGGVCREHR